MQGSRSNSILQGKEKCCYITRLTDVPLHKHHIYFGTGHRELSDKNGLWVWLLPALHNQTAYGVHGRDGRALDLRLKKECQQKYEESHIREEFMQLIGRNYL